MPNYQEAHHTSAVVDKSHRLVEEGVPVPYVAHPAPAHAHHGHGSYGKREAEADAEAQPLADADASADPYYSHGHGYRRGFHGYGHLAHAKVHPAPVHPVPVHAAHSPKKISPPVCESVPVKTCNRVPVSTPRKVPRTVCDTVVDITTIEDCHETVTKHCSQTSTSHHSHSAVVGHETKVLPQTKITQTLSMTNKHYSSYSNRLLLWARRWPMLAMPTMAEKALSWDFFLQRQTSYSGHVQRFTANKYICTTSIDDVQFHPHCLQWVLMVSRFQMKVGWRTCQDNINFTRDFFLILP